MRSLIMAALLLLVAVAPLSAEVCVKHHTHTDAYYYGGTTNPEVNRHFELWFGEGRMALVEENTTMFFDMTDSMFTFIHNGDSLYLQTKLPIQWQNVIVEEEVGRIQMYQYTGEIGEAGEKKSIDGRECTAHMLTTWIPYQDIKYNEGDNIAWYTDDVPFDVGLFQKAWPCLLTLRNYNQELIETLSANEGFPVRTEETRYQKGIEIKTVTKVEEIGEMDAPAGFWKVPEGYEKRDRITIRELQGN